MVLKLLAAAYAHFPTEYTVHVVTTLIVVLATRRISQGRKTTRERDMHARVVVLTGAFTPLGLTLLESLAQRGAHVIALTPYPVASEHVATYIDLLRSTTSNENIYAEQCDLADPPSIHAFATRFVTGDKAPTASPPRVDALVCAHEYTGVGAFALFARGAKGTEAAQRERDVAALGTFLLTTLLLPAMLTAPVERDIRIVNVVNRFYAAAAPRLFKDAAYLFPTTFYPSTPATSTPPSTPPSTSTSPLLPEATRALRTVLLTRHLQRVLDALPSAPVPDPAAAPISTQKSNIVAVSVSPGLSRAESVAPLFGFVPEEGRWDSWMGRVVFCLLYPVLLLFTKSASASVQSVLHVLFLPTPVKIKSSKSSSASSSSSKNDPLAEPEEALKPGALYAECAVVRLGVPAPPASDVDGESMHGGASASAKEKGKEKEKATDEIPDDGELGGERAGRAVWEAYEVGLRGWDKEGVVPGGDAGDGAKEKGKAKEKGEAEAKAKA